MVCLEVAPERGSPFAVLVMSLDHLRERGERQVERLAQRLLQSAFVHLEIQGWKRLVIRPEFGENLLVEPPVVNLGFLRNK